MNDKKAAVFLNREKRRLVKLISVVMGDLQIPPTPRTMRLMANALDFAHGGDAKITRESLTRAARHACAEVVATALDLYRLRASPPKPR